MSFFHGNTSVPERPSAGPIPARTPEETLQWIRQALKQYFRLDPRTVTPESNLYADLGLDSIDELELAHHMQEYTGRRLHPDEYRALYTVQDVIDCIQTMQEA